MQRTTDYSVPLVKGRQIYWLITAEWLAHHADEWMFGLPASCTRHFEPLQELFLGPDDDRRDRAQDPAQMGGQPSGEASRTDSPVGTAPTLRNFLGDKELRIHTPGAGGK